MEKKGTVIGYKPTKEQIAEDKKAFKDRKPAVQQNKAPEKDTKE